jgi:hypothetical protein
VRANYLGRENPWGLVPPPDWFLDQLTAFDPDLVILPGKAQAVYRLARRVRRSLGLQTVTTGLDSETARMIRERVVPVTAILPWTNWGPQIFQALRAGDTWRAGGADRWTDTLEAQEAEQASRADAARRDDLEHGIGPSAWWSYTLRAGSTVMAPGRPSPQSRAAASPDALAGSGV